MRQPVKPLTKAVARFADRLLSRFRHPEVKEVLPPPGNRSKIRHAGKGSAPRYLRRHAHQAGLPVVNGRLTRGPIPKTRRGRKARARIMRLLKERLG